MTAFQFMLEKYC